MRHRAFAIFFTWVVWPLGAACTIERGGRADSAAVPPAPRASADTAEVGPRSEDPFAADTLGLAQFAEPAAADTARRAALFATITPDAVNKASGVPAVADSAGPDVVHTQVLLDQAGFSPGIMDGHWGHNTTTAIRAFQAANGLPVTGALDDSTRQRLQARGANRTPVVRYTVTAADVKGPFVKIPPSPYAQAQLRCMCYESPGEALGEKFHVTAALLSQLNGGIDLTTVRAGQELWVPDVQRPATAGALARIVVFERGGFLQGQDSSGTVLFHFPSTLGSQYDPSPTGDFHVTRVSRNPDFHYDPKLYAEVPDWKEDATLKPGPNSPVGVVWMALNEPHYGIHGTATPETIGYSDSHGCIRLTNWDASWLADHVAVNTPVEFR